MKETKYSIRTQSIPGPLEEAEPLQDIAKGITIASHACDHSLFIHLIHLYINDLPTHIQRTLNPNTLKKVPLLPHQTHPRISERRLGLKKPNDEDYLKEKHKNNTLYSLYPFPASHYPLSYQQKVPIFNKQYLYLIET